jgi:hypothetical protein
MVLKIGLKSLENFVLNTSLKNELGNNVDKGSMYNYPDTITI